MREVARCGLSFADGAGRAGGFPAFHAGAVATTVRRTLPRAGRQAVAGERRDKVQRGEPREAESPAALRCLPKPCALMLALVVLRDGDIRDARTIDSGCMQSGGGDVGVAEPPPAAVARRPSPGLPAELGRHGSRIRLQLADQAGTCGPAVRRNIPGRFCRCAAGIERAAWPQSPPRHRGDQPRPRRGHIRYGSNCRYPGAHLLAPTPRRSKSARLARFTGTWI